MGQPDPIRLLEELIARRLSPEARAHAAQHLLRCPSCRRKLAEYRRIRERLAPARPGPYESQ